MRLEFKKLGLLLIMTSLILPDLASAYGLTCKSKDFKYNLCPTDGRIVRATMKRQLSNSPCVYGRSWGYQGYGLWVNHGCQADFEVSTSGPPFPNPAPYPPNPFPPYPAPYPSPGPWPDQAPSWAIGRWQTVMPFRGDYRYVQIYPSGSVVYYGPDGPAQGYWWQNSIRFYDGGMMNVRQDGFYPGRIRIDISAMTQLSFRRVG